MRRKTLLVGVLVIAVAVAAVVGGTYAIFTDTESAHVKFQAGTIAIDVSGDVFTQAYLNPDGFDDWKPGDYQVFPIHIDNTGNNKAWIQIYIYETGPWDDPLTTPNFWDVATHGVNAPGTWNQWVLDPGAGMDLGLWVDFPQWVGNDYQGAQGDLLILVVAKQWRNKYGEYSCVALEDKDSDYLPILGNSIEGIVCYKPDGTGGLEVDVNGYGLIPGEYYQLALNGTGGSTNFEDTSFAGMVPGETYLSGWWNFTGPYLEATCTNDPWCQGAYNFTGTYGEVQATDPDGDGLGSISWGDIVSGLPNGTYDQVKFVVKHITGYTPPSPGPGNEGSSWAPVMMEMDYLSFNIP